MMDTSRPSGCHVDVVERGDALSPFEVLGHVFEENHEKLRAAEVAPLVLFDSGTAPIRNGHRLGAAEQFGHGG